MRKYAALLGTGVALTLALGACGSDDVTTVTQPDMAAAETVAVATWADDLGSDLEPCDCLNGESGEDLDAMVAELAIAVEAAERGAYGEAADHIEQANEHLELASERLEQALTASSER